MVTFCFHARRNGVRHDAVGENRVNVQRVRLAVQRHGMHEVVAVFAGALVVEGNGHVGLGGLAVIGEQQQLRGRAVQGLVDHDFQNPVEHFGRAGIIVVAHALQAELGGIFQPDADHKGLQYDAFRLQGTAHSARIFVAGLNAVGDQYDDVPRSCCPGNPRQLFPANVRWA
jgi:hypothetical protein